MQNESPFIVYRAQRTNVNIMLYTYVLKIACVSRLKTKVESQGFIRCRHHGYVLNHVLYFIKTFLVVIKKTFVLSVVLNIMVDKGCLLSCVVAVVRMWDNIGACATRLEDREHPGMVCKTCQSESVS